MTAVIWKHELKKEPGEQVITAPSDSVFISAQRQEEDIAEAKFYSLQLWASSNLAAIGEYGLKEFKFSVVYTGKPFDDKDCAFIDTVQIDGLVYHVWQVWR